MFNSVAKSTQHCTNLSAKRSDWKVGVTEFFEQTHAKVQDKFQAEAEFFSKK